MGLLQQCSYILAGESLKNVDSFPKIIGMDVFSSGYLQLNREIHSTHGKNMLDKITPTGKSTAWRTDELYLKVKGNTKYLYALMDDENRFWIAQQVAETKNTADITPLFQKGKDNCWNKTQHLD